jgi:NADH-quinone oxidoreductase subunit C
MADESKAPPKPESSKPEVSGSIPAPSAAGAPSSSPAKSAAPAPSQVPLNNELSRRYRERFGAAILDALEDRKQSILIVDAAQFLEIARYSRDEEKFDLLEDYTAVDWPRRGKRFDLVAQLYSFTHNTRLRLKIPLGADDQPATLVPIWPAANWLEREVWDLFGIVFDGHPDPRRLLMPEDWEGYPLRKDYPVQIHLAARITEPLQVSEQEFRANVEKDRLARR